MTTSRNDAGELYDEAELGAADAANPLYMPWQTLSTLATETGQAVRQTFTESGLSVIGHVQQGSQHHTSPNPHKVSDRSDELLLDSGQVGAVQEVEANKATASGSLDGGAVQADIKRVERKMMSADAATEVVLRFNFMSARESRVGSCCHSTYEKQQHCS